MTQARTTHTLLLLLSVLLVTAGQVLLKQAVTRHPIARPGDLLGLLASGWAIAGVAAYGLGSVVWLFALSSLPFFLVTFFMVLPFALLLVAALVLFGERPTPVQWVGIATVIVGLVLILWRGRS